MKLPQTETPQRYVGLYVIDFGDQCGVGYTAGEVAVLLESERFTDVTVYKINRLATDGTMELNGVGRERFSLESGMFFHCRDERSGRGDFSTLIRWYDRQGPPCRVKLHLSRRDNQLLLAVIYPAEYEHEIGLWLSDSGFVGCGTVDAGVSQVGRYYQGGFDILERRQLYSANSAQDRQCQELLAAVGDSFQR